MFEEQVSEKTNEKIKEIMAAAERQVIFDLIVDRVRSSPEYSLGDLLTEVKGSKAMLEKIGAIRIVELAKAIQRNAPSPGERKPRERNTAKDIQEEYDAVTSVLCRSIGKSLSRKAIVKASGIDPSNAAYRLKKLIANGVIISDKEGFRLRTVEQREYILNTLKDGPVAKNEIIHAAKIPFVSEVLDALEEYGTIVCAGSAGASVYSLPSTKDRARPKAKAQPTRKRK